MSRRKLYILLGVAAVAVTIQNVWFFSNLDRPPQPAAEVDEALETETGEADPSPDVSEVRAVSYSEILDYLDSFRAGRDPRNPFLTRAEADRLANAGSRSEGSGALPVLSGTLWSATRRVAWMDGFPYVEGDSIGMLRIERIEPGAIVLESAGRGRSIRIEASGSSAPPAEEPAPEPTAGDAP